MSSEAEVKETASLKTLRRQLERESKFIKRARKLRLSPAVIAESQARADRYKELLDE